MTTYTFLTFYSLIIFASPSILNALSHMQYIQYVQCDVFSHLKCSYTTLSAYNQLLYTLCTYLKNAFTTFFMNTASTCTQKRHI